MMQEWDNNGVPKPPGYRRNPETWQIWDWTKVLGSCAGDDGDLIFDSESVKESPIKLRSPNARARTKMKARRLILEADNSTESRAAIPRGRPNLEAGIEWNEKTVVREKEVLVKMDLRTSAMSSTPVVSSRITRKEKVKAIMTELEASRTAFNAESQRVDELTIASERKKEEHAAKLAAKMKDLA
ncbi:hypothetical protein AXG93_1617s1310 [Marchantia polymorpha subsp. ruderalis]|uniref:No apical meristem-associated C-terminal domain-containing protein n=1 Tax=Marchantia polymorpha subsp. ruderalis TaxID=1480154 RepID=A0A176W9A1_MARPO|nr:hypothetical protein AXG93_1617s1310 [Marchantia polymorpha subsp. ruderalis]